jgi:tRNA(Ile)-lysidine synthase
LPACARNWASSTAPLSGKAPNLRAAFPAAAREARYRLLAGVARDEGVGIVVTGHTADDQAETVVMRQARDEGPGLAGMAPATLYGGDVWILRPLLAERRSALRTLLTVSGRGWIDDPTNLDPAFERPRARAMLAADENRVEDLLATARRVAPEREDLGRRAAALIDRYGRRLAPGLIRLAPEFVAETDPQAVLPGSARPACRCGRDALPPRQGSRCGALADVGGRYRSRYIVADGDRRAPRRPFSLP